MKKARKTRLHIEREVLRVLEDHELRQVEGGGPTKVPNLPVTGDSQNVCCA